MTTDVAADAGHVNGDHDAEHLFQEHTARDIEAISTRVAEQAQSRQQAVRALISDRFRDLLGVSRTVVDMSEQLVSLRETLETLQRTSDDVARLHTQRSSACAPAHREAADVQYAAALLIVADAPGTIRSSMASHAYIQAAWAITFASKAWIWMQEIQTAPKFASMSSHWADMQALRGQVIARLDTCMQSAGLKTEELMDVLVAHILLHHESLPAALEYFHTQRVKAVSHVCTQAASPVDRITRVVRVVLRTLRQTSTLFARPTLSRILLHVGQTFFEFGASLCERSSFAPVAASGFYAFAPNAVQAYDPPPLQDTPCDADVDAANGAFVKRIRDELDTALLFLAHDDDLEMLTQCRQTLAKCTADAPPHFDVVATHIRGLLDARVQTILQHMLSDVPSLFASALERTMHAEDSDPNALNELFKPQHVEPRHWRTHRSLGMDECIALVETRLGRVVRSSRDVVAAPAESTCAALFEQLMQINATSIVQLHWLLRVCLALYTSPVLTRILDRDFFNRLADMYAMFGKRWARVSVEHVVRMDRGVMPSLLMLAHALHTLGPNPLPPPPVLDEWVHQTGRDGLTMPTLLAAEHTDASRVRLVLAPWIQADGRKADATDDSSMGSHAQHMSARLARVVPRFTSW